MTYEEAREFIDQSNQYGSILGLVAIKELLNSLGNPQDRLKVIHVAGTNGKGSTTAFISSILSSEGYLVGRYISPAVFTYRERIQISRRDDNRIESDSKEDYDAFAITTDYITKQGVCDTIAVIQPICEGMVRDGFAHPTCFEIETVMAILYFSWEQVDFAVIEVGLGGRLDATNVIKKPICSIITSISMDHMQFLGDTLELITREKAGIIKKGSPVITGNKNPEVLRVLEQTCDELGTDLTIVEDKETVRIQTSPEETIFYYREQEYAIRLLGEHQISNAILAIHTGEILNRLGYPISDRAIKNGLVQARWSGRFEVIAKEPYFIIDGAHNEDAALQLKKSIQLYFSERRIIFIMGVFADKEYKNILKITAPLAEVIITITPDNSRALVSSQLAKEAKKYGKGEIIDAGTVEQAVKYAYEKASKEDVIIAFGSLSFLGDLYNIITSHQYLVD
ncbi:MAG: bifunctional folylpolyglutamate synthase/dihydrofolate synthase [Mobilitalea sp.]